MVAVLLVMAVVACGECTVSGDMHVLLICLLMGCTHLEPILRPVSVKLKGVFDMLYVYAYMC